MNIEQIKAYIGNKIEELTPRKDDDFEYRNIRGQLEAYQDILHMIG